MVAYVDYVGVVLGKGTVVGIERLLVAGVDMAERDALRGGRRLCHLAAEGAAGSLWVQMKSARFARWGWAVQVRLEVSAAQDQLYALADHQSLPQPTATAAVCSFPPPSAPSCRAKVAAASQVAEPSGL